MSWAFGDHVSVYLPQSYNFAGQTLVVPSDRITRVDGAELEGDGVHRVGRSGGGRAGVTGIED